MSKKDFKPKKNSQYDITRKYANDYEACVQFFKDIKWPNGFTCEKCGCTHCYTINKGKVFECSHCKKHHYLLAGTIFQGSKLDLYKIILGLYLFFSATKGYSATEMRNALDVNYDTALLLCKKCRLLMEQSNSKKVLDSLYYESDVTYIGARTEGKRGMATDKQPFLVILSTLKDNNHPEYIKITPISKDKGEYIESVMNNQVLLSKDRVLNTDGKTTYNVIAEDIQLVSKIIDYKDTNHRLYWLNTIWSNIKSNIQGIYHGIPKKSMLLFGHEQEWRFNHRYTGTGLLGKIQSYISESRPMMHREFDLFLGYSEA